MNKKLLISFILTVFTVTAYPQDYTPGAPVRISILPYLENWSGTDNTDFSVFGTILNLTYLPLKNTTVSLSSRYASVTGDVSELNGFPDAQIFISQKLTDYNIMFNAGINIPSGKTKLNEEEFVTSRIISQNIFNLKTSGFGQGLNVFFGASWTHPLSEKFVIGTGISYQIKNEYQPVSINPQKYQPSNEISVSAGVDIKLNETMTLAGDLTAIIYGKDKVDGKEIFSTGNRIIFNTLFRQYYGYHTLSFMLLYRAIGKGDYKDFNPLIESEKINPDHLYIGSVFNHRISSVTRISYGAAVNKYEKTDLFFSGYTFFELSLAPEFRVTRQIVIPLMLRYSIGSANEKPDLKNYELSTGIRIQL